MPVNQFYDPKQLRGSKQELKLGSIPMFSYQKELRDERGTYSDSDLIRIYEYMQTIREFETMLLSVRTTKLYNGVEYVYTGPAHLYLGQEASAVGQSFSLSPDDFIFGTHRSHGEVIAKGLAAINALDASALDAIMRGTFDGKPLKAVEGKQINKSDIKELALDFFLYGLTCELFGRENGFAKGLGNSMHLFFIPFGIYPNNAIVGGSAGIGAGAALYKKINQKPGIIVANAGDGALGCGPLWEGMHFASMDQFRELWDGEFAGGLPIIFNFMNNGYGMGGQTNGETMGYKILARVGSGINPENMHAERVDGYNPLAVIDAYRRKKQVLLDKKGPVLLDVLTYRTCGHSTSDQNSYRSKEEIEAWTALDAIADYRGRLAAEGILSADAADNIAEGIKERVTKILKLAIDDSASPRMDLIRDPDSIARYMFSNQSVKNMGGDAKPLTLTTKEENSRVQKLAKKERVGIKNGKPVSALKAFSYRDAIFEAIFDKFYEDSTLIAFGEDNRYWGGAFGVYAGMTESLPYHRFFNSPISEAAIVAASVGYAMCGGRSVPELMYCDFIGRAGDEILNQLAKWQSMTAGLVKMPVVLRVSVGAKYGAQHSQDWTSLTAHIPGLKVVFPATPYDAKGLMNAALSGTDPVVFFESQRLYDIGELFAKDGVPSEYYEIPIGEPDVKLEGSDVTILSVGATLYQAKKAADILKDKYNMSAELIDARSLVPFNYEKVIESIKKTGRILLTSDACERGSHLADFARNITELAFDYLDAPPVVVGSRNWISPCAELEDMYFPQASWIIDAIHEKIMPLPGHAPQHNFSQLEQLRLERLGI